MNQEGPMIVHLSGNDESFWLVNNGMSFDRMEF